MTIVSGKTSGLEMLLDELLTKQRKCKRMYNLVLIMYAWLPFGFNRTYCDYSSGVQFTVNHVRTLKLAKVL